MTNSVQERVNAVKSRPSSSVSDWKWSMRSKKAAPEPKLVGHVNHGSAKHVHDECGDGYLKRSGGALNGVFDVGFVVVYDQVEEASWGFVGPGGGDGVEWVVDDEKGGGEVVEAGDDGLGELDGLCYVAHHGGWDEDQLCHLHWDQPSEDEWLMYPVQDQKPKTQAGRHNKDKPMIEIDDMGDLPGELVIEILCRLPVKNLGQFRYVSGEQEESGKYSVIIELTSMDKEGNVKNKIRASIDGVVYGFVSCDGLVLLCSMFCAYIYNPGKQELARVPRSCYSTRYCTVGFGHLPSCNEYKIVHLFCCDDPFIGDTRIRCEVFSIREGGRGSNSGASWKRIGNCPFDVVISGSPLCVKGVVYWKASEERNGLNREFLLSFDLEKEEFKVISYPNCSAQWFMTGLKGYLCLVECGARTSMEIWLLKNYNHDIWVKEYGSISLPGFGVEGLVPLDDHDGEILINTEQKGLVCYCTESRTFKGIKNAGKRARTIKKGANWTSGHYSAEAYN
ncbi:hypothetical protein RJ640_005115 [Escallonia rubra]|uniref:F-box associated beta-propeller type 3 domain-containing protein n=1 Tax=Escallonia rubra TaxID=112253 RepID=A0AA88RHJ1_9ASTE|nr:hypothetical protein RJ640_005115 [Escallonia rubra]